MADKVKDARLYAANKARYIGLGDADTPREEFVANVHRDTLLTYTAVAMNRSPEVVRQQMIKKMVQPKST
ncbi:hypothetical protein JA9_001134 [Meyerozyma sp. JA9]|nr:hypothetical protein JA9_001134 [Meyerozyma sp. JA9]